MSNTDRMESDMGKKCKSCKDYEATEASGYCFTCADEMACHLADVARELGIDPVKAARRAWYA